MPHSVSPSPTVCSRAPPDRLEDDGRVVDAALSPDARLLDAPVRLLLDSVRVPLADVLVRLPDSVRPLLADVLGRVLPDSLRALLAVALDEPEAARGMRSVWPGRMVSVSISLASRTASTVTS